MKKVFIISFVCFFVGVFVFLFNLQGNVERVRLLEAIASRQAQTQSEPIRYQKKADGTSSRVIIPNGPKAFFEIIISVLSKQALVLVKINADRDSQKSGLDAIFQTLAESNSFENRVIFVSINLGDNPQNHKILDFLKKKLNLKDELELPIFAFFHNNHLLLPLQPGIANKENLQQTIQRFLKSEADNNANTSQQQPSQASAHDDRNYPKLCSKFDDKLALNKKNRRSVWKRNAGLYKKLDALF